MNTLLVITSKPDPHIGMVGNHLPLCQIVILDPRDFPNLNLSFYIEQGSEKVMLGDQDITNTSVVWFRKPEFYEPKELLVPEKYQLSVHETYESYIKWLYATFRQALWVSNPWNIFRGNSKLYQMQLAKQLGFTVSPMVMTGDPEVAKAFVENHQRVVVKPLSPPGIFEGTKYRTMYTQRVDRNKISYEGLGLTPVIFQEEVIGTDIRVTVVDEKIFACRIEMVGSISNDIDWRQHQLGEELIYSNDTKFPDHLAHRCIEMVKRMGLVYGAFDFIEANGEYTFLEINPNGQWGFIEEKTGMQISKAIADMMSGAFK